MTTTTGTAEQAAAEAIHRHRCRHQHFNDCTGPTGTDLAYARAALSAIRQLAEHAGAPWFAHLLTEGNPTC